jgi:serine/alanine adding enzyme
VEFRLLCEENMIEWKNFVLNHNQGDIFHMPEWADVNYNTYGFLNLYTLVYAKGKLIGVLPIIRVKGIFKNYLTTPPAGILLEDGVKDSEEIIKYFLKLRNKFSAQNVEIYNSIINNNSWHFCHESVFVIKKLPNNKEDLWKEIGSKRRNMVRRAERNKLEVKIELPVDESMAIFYKIYSFNYRDLGTPVHNFNYFLEQAKLMHENIRILIIYLKYRPIGAMWLHLFNNSISDPEAAAIRRYFHTGVNDYMYYKAFEFAVENGYNIFNMGRSQKNTGTYNFKLSWGNCHAEEYSILRYMESKSINEKKRMYAF